MFGGKTGNTAFAHSIGNLAKFFINDVAGGKNTGLRGLHFDVGVDKALVVIELIQGQHLHVGANADQYENTVQINLSGLFGFNIFNSKADNAA